MRPVFFSTLIIFMLVVGCTSQSEKTSDELTEKIIAQKMNGTLQPKNETIRLNETSSINETREEVRENTAQEVQCVDSDGGNDSFSRGTVEKAGQTFLDACLNGSATLEYYCADNNIKNSTISCQQDYICMNGACIKPETPKCTDSDNGMDFFVRGYVQSGGHNYYDTCPGPDSVKEYYCQNDAISEVIRNCPSGRSCVTGACIRNIQTCNDSDGGIDINSYGEVKLIDPGGIGYSYMDRCESSVLLKEYYCIDGNVSYQLLPCNTDVNEECLRSACQKPVICNDSDGGLTPGIKGSVIVVEKFDLDERQHAYEDSCSNANTLKEYYCSDDRASYNAITCNGNCTDGAC